MANARTRRTILDVLATDTTWQRVGHRGDGVWQGKCLSCNRKLVVSLDGSPISRVTIEHIVPKHHGGTDDLVNLGLTCARCNHGKGARHDRRPLSDPTLQRVITHLQEERQARWRERG